MGRSRKKQPDPLKEAGRETQEGSFGGKTEEILRGKASETTEPTGTFSEKMDSEREETKKTGRRSRKKQPDEHRDTHRAKQVTPRPEGKTPRPEEKTPEPEGKTPGPEGKAPRPEGKTPEPEEKTSRPEQKTPGPAQETLGAEPKTHKSRAENHKSGSDSMSDREIRRYILLLSVPFVAILVIVVFLVSGNLKEAPEGITQAQSETAQGSRDSGAHIPVIEPDTKEYIMDFGGSILAQDTVPEINQLMEQYFLAISNCDMDTFLHLFTSQDTSEEQEFRDTFEKQREYIEGYRNISCYTVKGPEPDSYVAYVSYDVKFVGVDTPGPDLVRIYAVKGEDGQYRIYDQAVTPELESYLDHVAQNEDVRLLVSQVDQKAAEAMEADEALKLRIMYLKNGPDYMQEDGTTVPGE